MDVTQPNSKKKESLNETYLPNIPSTGVVYRDRIREKFVELMIAESREEMNE